MRSRILSTGDSAWMKFLSACQYDIYHLPAYVEIEATRMEGEACAVFVEGERGAMLLPLIIRSVPVELTENGRPALDAISPYGYCSPLFQADFSRADPEVASAARMALATLADHGICSAFIRLHPLLPFPRADIGDVGTVVDHAETVWIDLTLSEEQLWGQTRATHRNLINKARRLGAEALIDTGWDHFQAFTDLYTSTMARLDAQSWYFFSREYFEQLREQLAAHVHLCVVLHEGTVVAAGLFTETCGTVQYHLSGTALGSNKVSPTRLMLNHVRGWARSRGNPRFHLGGGAGASEDSLFRFKAGFSNLRGRFSSWRLISDQARYDEVVSAWRQSTPDSAIEPEDHFPPYRQ